MRSRGVVNLVDEWNVRHAEARAVWTVEGIIETTNAAIDMARQLYDHFRRHGEFPPSDKPLLQAGNFGYFIHLLKKLLAVANDVDDRAGTLEAEGCDVAGVDKLRDGLDALEAIISEDALATEAAFFCGSICE